MKKEKDANRLKVGWRKWVRRLHLYAGLMMFPWLLLFGLSGLLFNHPNIGEDVKGTRLAPEQLEAFGISAWEPNAAADALVEELAEQYPDQNYSRDTSYDGEFSGLSVLTAPAKSGQHILILEMTRGVGILASKKARPHSAAPFAKAHARLPEYSTRAIERKAKGLLAARGMSSQAPLRVHPKIAPELRFRLKRGTELWNVTYNTGSGKLAGRRVGAWSDIGITQLLGKLHTTHHFTLGLSAQWFWAFFEDLLGLVMVVWTLSGLLMWWQMKATRLAGAVSIGLALAVAGTVMWSNASHIMFGDVAQALGPGE